MRYDKYTSSDNPLAELIIIYDSLLNKPIEIQTAVRRWNDGFVGMSSVTIEYNDDGQIVKTPTTRRVEQ